MKLVLRKVLQKITTQAFVESRKVKTISDYKREALATAGKQQFEKLKDLGLNIPVSLA